MSAGACRVAGAPQHCKNELTVRLDAAARHELFSQHKKGMAVQLLHSRLHSPQVDGEHSRDGSKADNDAPRIVQVVDICGREAS
jgi:hypothetical protein